MFKEGTDEEDMKESLWMQLFKKDEGMLNIKKNKQAIMEGLVAQTKQASLPAPITVTKTHHTDIMEEIEKFPVDITELSNGELLLQGATNGGHNPFTISLKSVKEWLIKNKLLDKV